MQATRPAEELPQTDAWVRRVCDALSSSAGEPARRIISRIKCMVDHSAVFYRDAKLRPCRGCLIVGPPGSGKTSLANTIASSERYRRFVFRRVMPIVLGLGRASMRWKRCSSTTPSGLLLRSNCRRCRRALFEPWWNLSARSKAGSNVHTAHPSTRGCPFASIHLVHDLAFRLR